jgi:hypothetical protein
MGHFILLFIYLDACDGTQGLMPVLAGLVLSYVCTARYCLQNHITLKTCATILYHESLLVLGSHTIVAIQNPQVFPPIPYPTLTAASIVSSHSL